MVLLSFVLVMFCETIEKGTGKFLGLTEKNKILTFLGLGMGGILIALQALVTNGAGQRAKRARWKGAVGEGVAGGRVWLRVKRVLNMAAT